MCADTLCYQLQSWLLLICTSPSLKVIRTVSGNHSAALCYLPFALHSHVLCASDTVPPASCLETSVLTQVGRGVPAETLENLEIHLGLGFLKGTCHDASANRSTGQLYASFLQEKGCRNQCHLVGLKLPEFGSSLLCA